MSNKNKPYNFLAFLDQDPHSMTTDQKEFVRNEIEKVGASIDSGIFRKQPHLMAALGQRLIEEASKRMGINTQPNLDGSDNQASPDGSPGGNDQPTYKPGSYKPGLFRD